MSDDMQRRIEKLVSLLARADGRFDRRDGDVIRIDDGVGLKRTRVTVELRTLAMGRGLVEIESDTIRLTAAGRALAARLSDHPQAYRLQHGAVSHVATSLVDETPPSSGGVVAMVDDAESPLAWLHRRKGTGGLPLLDATEFAAGERLRLDFTKGGMMPSVTSNWRDMASSGGGGRGGRAEMTDAALAARTRVTAALRAVGPELAGVAIDVCCFLKGLETVESDRRWPQRSAKVVLKLALQGLARHYGIGSQAVGAMGKGRVEHWGAADYRPKIGGEV